MSEFNYRAIDNQSNISQGRLSARNIDDVERILASQGMTLIEAESASLLNIGDLFSVSYSQKDLLDFTYLLKLIVNSGMPLMNGIRDLMKGHSNKKITFVSTTLYQGLDSGMSLSEIMDSQPRIFPSYYTQMVKAGEASGTLDNSLEFLLKYLDWQIEFKNTLRSSFSYPITILTVTMGLAVIIFTVVFPKMLKLLTGLGKELPLPTKIMVAISSVLKGYFPIIILLAIIAIVLYRVFRNTPGVRRFVDHTILKLPLIGNLVLKINISRYFKIVATLHSAGLNIERTFVIGAEVVGNSVMAEKFRAIPAELLTGVSISETMRRTGLVQDLAIDIIGIAEKSGKLDEALNRCSDILDKEVPETIKKLVRFIEPLTMVLLGGLVLMLLLSIFLPIYKIVGNIKVR